jgi:hypothetical protein
MRIQPVAFNYKKLKEEMPDLQIDIKRKNVVVQNDRYVMWGENIDEENGIMMLMSVSLSRKYTKETKLDIFDEWKNFLHKFAAELPEEIKRKWNEREEKRRVIEQTNKLLQKEKQEQTQDKE